MLCFVLLLALPGKAQPNLSYLNVGTPVATPPGLPSGTAIIQKQLLVGGTVFPAGIAADDAVHLGQTWLHKQIIFPAQGTSVNRATWAIYNWDAEGSLNFNPNWNSNNWISFRSNGDAVFRQKMSIGNVTCLNTPCTGPLGINNMTLAVGGRIGAQGGVHIINVGAAWPDYVFRPDYALPALATVEAFIATHQHLPDVPSAADVAENGIELATMDATLLRKVEELTLHLIRLEKENRALQGRLLTVETALKTTPEPALARPAGR